MTDIAVIACDSAGRVTQANEHAVSLFGYPQSELIGLSIQELVPPRFRERHREHLQAFLEGPLSAVSMGDRRPVFGYRRDGSEFPAEASISKFREGDQWVLVVSLRDISERQQANAELVWRANHDPLTGLPNRALLRDRLANALQRNHLQDYAVALLFIDLDGFKRINDSYGHEAGDAILMEARRRLMDSVRPGDTVARLGGDEFVVLCEQFADLEAIGTLAERLNGVMREPFPLADQEVFVTASIGVSLGHGDSQSAEELLRDADAAMYQVKERGRDGWQVFSGDLYDKAQRRLELASGLRTAVEDGTLSVHLQPIVGAQDGVIRGAEVLLRWSLNDQPVSPADFIPVSEATGSILPIGEWVFAQTCRVAAQLADLWRENAPYLSVNVSHRQLSDPDLTEQFARILAKSGAAPERIILELTESTVMSDTPAGLDTINRLAGLGLGIAVDDFGTGYSSLSQLLRLPVSTLKVDREFVDGIQGNTEHYAIVDAVLRMTRVLRLQVVAEGVENHGQAQLLREMGSEFLQGFHFHRPLPEAQFIALLERNRNRPLAPVEPLWYTIYASTASGTLDRRQLVELLHQARQRNAELGLTGCLLYLDGAFIQMLEGSEEALAPVMASIRRDERHHELRDIASGRTPTRLFRSWRMGFYDLAAQDLPADLGEVQSGRETIARLAQDPWLCYNLMRLISLGMSEDRPPAGSSSTS